MKPGSNCDSFHRKLSSLYKCEKFTGVVKFAGSSGRKVFGLRFSISKPIGSRQHGHAVQDENILISALTFDIIYFAHVLNVRVSERTAQTIC